MSEAIIPKTQQEWSEHLEHLLKELGRQDSDKILLAKKEVEEAREERMKRLQCSLFLTEHSLECASSRVHDPECVLCLKLTQFAKEGEDE